MPATIDPLTLGALAAIIWALTDLVKPHFPQTSPRTLAFLISIPLGAGAYFAFVVYPQAGEIITAIGSIVLAVLGSNILQNMAKAPAAPVEVKGGTVVVEKVVGQPAVVVHDEESHRHPPQGDA